MTKFSTIHIESDPRGVTGLAVICGLFLLWLLYSAIELTLSGHFNILTWIYAFLILGVGKIEFNLLRSIPIIRNEVLVLDKQGLHTQSFRNVVPDDTLPWNEIHNASTTLLGKHLFVQIKLKEGQTAKALKYGWLHKKVYGDSMLLNTHNLKIGEAELADLVNRYVQEYGHTQPRTITNIHTADAAHVTSAGIENTSDSDPYETNDISKWWANISLAGLVTSCFLVYLNVEQGEGSLITTAIGLICATVYYAAFHIQKGKSAVLHCAIGIVLSVPILFGGVMIAMFISRVLDSLASAIGRLLGI